jgi:hypothetical protein
MSYTDPKSWGPHFWFMMRCVANNYSQNPSSQERRHVIDFYNNLKYVLPCKNCAFKYKNQIEKYPVADYSKNKNMLMDWVEMIYQNTDRDKRAGDHKCSGNSCKNPQCPNCHGFH